ncbi:unnamed protein product [Closterium sp. Naga37s-1]|nr:unnamed protein product [Closterium sp. Naga37s-1]
MDGDSELGGDGGDGEKGKGGGAGKGKGGGAEKGKRGRRCGRWEIICWVGIGAGVVMTGIGLTMLVFFLSLTQQEPVVTVEGVDIVRLSISIPSQTIKMPSLDPSMVTVPNLGGSVPSLANISMPAFELGKKQTKIATVPIVVKSFPLLSTSSSAQVRSPIADVLRERKIKMQTFINTQGKVRVWGIASPTYNVTVMCVMTVDPSADVMTKKECGAKPTKV